MRGILLLAAFAALLLTVPAAAQTWLIPAGMNIGTTEGNYEYHFPFNPTVGHVQNIINQTRMGPARMIKGIRFRPDGVFATYRPWPAQKVTDLTVGVANHPGPQYCDRYSFKGNRKPDYLEVMTKATLSLPPCPLPTATPEPFSKGVDIKFAKPFFYKGTNGFLIDIERAERVYQYNRWYIDSHLQLKYVDPPTGTGALPRYYGTRVYIGTGCPTSYWTSMETPYPGCSIITYGEAKAPNMPVMVAIGNDIKNFVPGLPLPIDLGPLGATGCTVYVNWLLTAMTTTDPVDPNGIYRINWGQFPSSPIFNGAKVYSQGFALDMKYNALGLRVSKARDLTLGPGFPADIDGVTFHLEGAGTTGEDRPASWYPRVMIMETY